MSDKRPEIVQAGLAVIREQGFKAFSQLQVAARLKMRQSHLTYYFPTRNDLLLAVARAAMERQLVIWDEMLQITDIHDFAAVVGRHAAKQENTRVMIALAQASDEEPRLREVFRELAAGLQERMGTLLKNLGADSCDENRRLLHALSVGLAVVHLAVAPDDGENRAAQVFASALLLLNSAAAIRSPGNQEKGKRTSQSTKTARGAEPRSKSNRGRKTQKEP